jgi:hypothetical protein
VVDALHPPHPIEDLREFVDQAGTNQVGVKSRGCRPRLSIEAVIQGIC